jgi:hypothetical protein
MLELSFISSGLHGIPNGRRDADSVERSILRADEVDQPIRPAPKRKQLHPNDGTQAAKPSRREARQQLLRDADVADQCLLILQLANKH